MATKTAKTNPLWKQIYSTQNGLDHGINFDDFEFAINQVAEEVQKSIEPEIVVTCSASLTQCGEANIVLTATDDNSVVKKYVFLLSIPSFTTDGHVTVSICPEDKLPCGRMLTDYIDKSEDKKRKVKTFKVALDRGIKAIASPICKYFFEYADMYDEAFSERNRVGSKIEKVKTAIESIAITVGGEISKDGMSFAFEQSATTKGSVKVVSLESGQFKLELYTDDEEVLDRAISYFSVEYEIAAA